MKRLMSVAFALAVVTGTSALAQQQQRPVSPPGTATAMLGGDWVKNDRGNLTYQGGKWIEISYSRPMLRQRQNIFGSGDEYGKGVLAGAPVWRLGANRSTRIATEVPLTFAGKTLPAGEYSVFVDLKEGAWTLIFSNWAAQETYEPENKAALWGSYGYTPDKDALRVPMQMSSNDVSVDQLTIEFVDVTKTGGTLQILWDKTIAAAPFTVGS
jgi:hypothetical protein